MCGCVVMYLTARSAIYDTTNAGGSPSLVALEASPLEAARSPAPSHQARTTRPGTGIGTPLFVRYTLCMHACMVRCIISQGWMMQLLMDQRHRWLCGQCAGVQVGRIIHPLVPTCKICTVYIRRTLHAGLQIRKARSHGFSERTNKLRPSI